MAYWLMKSEPSAWSWDQQVKIGAKGTEWSGVRNHTAKLNLMKMKKGDRAFFYHSNEGKDIVGVVEIIREHHPDPTAEKGEPWVVVDVKALEPVPQPVVSARDVTPRNPVSRRRKSIPQSGYRAYFRSSSAALHAHRATRRDGVAGDARAGAATGTHWAEVRAG